VDQGTFLILFALGAGAIALWIHVRFPKLAPETMMKVGLHVGAAWVVGDAMLAAGGSMASGLVSVFLFYLPALVYCLLTAIWILQFLQQAVARQRFH
jgi:hypothetical protein